MPMPCQRLVINQHRGTTGPGETYMSPVSACTPQYKDHLKEDRDTLYFSLFLLPPGVPQPRFAPRCTGTIKFRHGLYTHKQYPYPSTF